MKIYTWVQSVLMRFGGSVALALLPLVAGASSHSETPPNVAQIDTVDDLVCLIQSIAAVVFWVLIAAAILFGIFSAYLYLFSGGDAEKVKKASRALTVVVVAIIVAVLSWVLPTIIGNFLGVSGQVAC